MTPEANQAVVDEDLESYADLALMPAERTVLGLLRGRLHEMEMLDIGVGAGRTGYTFAPLVQRYVGLDYSPQMVARARRLLGGDERVELIEGDARDLSQTGGPFDFVLFSFNGIDAVGHEDRLRILAEARKVLKPEGTFLFSGHSLGALPLSPRRPRARASSRLRDILGFAQDFRYAWGVRQSNRLLDLDTARRQGWTIVRDVAHDFSVQLYYVDPAEQLRQLAEVGLEATKVFDAAGREIDPLQSRRDPWLSYLCRASSASSSSAAAS